MEYSEKLTLHIPHFRWDGSLIPVDYLSFMRDVVSRLEGAGIEGCYAVTATGYYKGRSYEEDLLSVCCAREQADTVVSIFTQAYVAGNTVMRQESFAYEQGGRMFVVSLQDAKDTDGGV